MKKQKVYIVKDWSNELIEGDGYDLGKVTDGAFTEHKWYVFISEEFPRLFHDRQVYTDKEAAERAIGIETQKKREYYQREMERCKEELENL